jgi:hypothetical protein
MKINIASLPAFYINMESSIKRRHDFLRWNKQLKSKNVKRIAGVVGEPYYIGLSYAFQDTICAGLNSGGGILENAQNGPREYRSGNYPIRWGEINGGIIQKIQYEKNFSNFLLSMPYINMLDYR